jgi:arsenate reductase-like glutaredoxin family protein
VAEVVPASRKLSKDDAAKLAREASQVIVAKGKKLEEFEGGKASAEVLAAMLGPTGNLRAPCIRAGKTLLVGFNEEAYERVFG